MIYYDEYLDELSSVSQLINLEFLNNKKILISGGTGLIGSYLIDLLLLNKELNFEIVCLTTNSKIAKERFSLLSDTRIRFVEQNLSESFFMPDSFDYVLHMASFSDPKNYAQFPVETMLTNINGTKSMLDIAKNSHAKFLFTSSVEVYGTSEEEMIESNYGKVNPLDVRSCYNESKRASETLCISYNKEYLVDYINVRLSRVYGPTMKLDDSKALSQFIKNAINKEDIVLKSKGNQTYSYCYVADAVTAILFLLGGNQNMYNNTYNIANSHETFTLFEIASMIADINNTKVTFNAPSKSEANGYSRSEKAVLNTQKLENLGWKPYFNFKKGVMSTYNTVSKTLKQNGRDNQ